MSPAPVAPTLPPAPVLVATNIGSRRAMHQVKRGMILWAEALDPTGAEQRKRRPWVVVLNDAIHQHLPILQASPLTSKGDGGLPDHRITLQTGVTFQRFQSREALDARQTVLTEQTRVFAHETFMPHPSLPDQSVQVAGQVNDLGLDAIGGGLAFVYDVP